MVTLAAPGWSIDKVGAVLFDKDGTLIDSHLYWGRIIERRARAVLGHYRLSEALFAPLCRAMGYSLERRRLLPEGPIALVSREEVIAALARFLLGEGVAAGEEELAALFVAEHERFLEEIWDYVRILPGVRNLLERLHRYGIPAAVVTTDALRNTHESLRRLGLDGYFAAVIGKESTREPKVTGEPARAALATLGLEPEVAVCIGDAPMDLIMARNSGLRAGVGVASGQLGAELLAGQTPHVVSSLEELTVLEECPR